jgi:hypothetical protein
LSPVITTLETVFFSLLDPVFPQSGLLHLLAHQEPLGDLHLLQFRVAGEPDHFHAILERRRNRVENVGRGDEEDLA